MIQCRKREFAGGVQCGCQQTSVTHHLSTSAEIALSGKFPEDESKAGRELELRNMLNFDAFELVDELLPGKHACDTAWVDEWRSDRVRSRLCVRQFMAEGLRDDLFAGTPDTFFIKYLLAKAASCKDFGLLVVDTCVAFKHARTHEERDVKVLSGIKSSIFLATQGSSERNEESIKALARVLMRQARDKYVLPNERHPSVYLLKVCDKMDLEQHGDDLLVCGLTSNLEVLAGEFKNIFLVKKAEIASLMPEHQNESHFNKRRISVGNFGVAC